MALAAYQPPAVKLKDLFEKSSDSTGPQLDLDWDPFRSKIDRFLGEIDRYVQNAKSEIGGRVINHTNALRDIQADKAEVERLIAEERQREGDMLATLKDERRQVQELNASLSHLQNNLSKVREQSQQLEAELNAIRKEVTGERAEKERQGKTLASMKSRDQVDLDTLQEAIGWRVEGIGRDRLLMRFTLIDPTDPDREFAIVIDISKHDYSIPKCSPHLPNLAEMLRDLNTDRDFATFIKRVRKGFKGLCPNNEPTSRLDMLSGVTRTPARGKEQPTSQVEHGLETLSLGDKA